MITLLLFVPLVSAHGASVPIPDGYEEQSLHIQDYDFTFFSQPAVANKESEFLLYVTGPDGSVIEGADIQGQILDGSQGNEIFFAAVNEQDGMYRFSWKPSFAGEYIVQYIMRVGEESLEPTFQVAVTDKKGLYSLIAAIVVAVLVLGYGIYAALPRKKQKFRVMPLVYAVLIAGLVLLLGYSVWAYYGAGGEKGFVVCGEDGCELAVHIHSELEMEICGEPYHLPLENGDLDRQHTHKERDLLHYHSLIMTDESGTEILEPEKLRVGELFDHLDIPFTSECFAGKCNGDLCGDEPGELTMHVNGQKNEAYGEYSWRDGDVIEIHFGDVHG